MTSIQLVYLAGSPAAIFFPLYYHFTARWWRTGAGRLFMAMGMTSFSLYFSVAMFLLVPEGIIRDVIRLVFVVLASGVSWATVIMYRRFRREGMQRLGSKKRWMKQNRTDEVKGGEQDDIRS